MSRLGGVTGGGLWSQAMAVSSLATVLVIFGAYLAICVNVSRVAESFFTGPSLTVVLAPEAGLETGRHLAQTIAVMPGVSGAVYVDKAQALVRFQRQLGEHSHLLEGLEDNPLPDTVEVLLEPGRSPDSALLSEMAGLHGVDEVLTSRPWLRRLDKVFATARQMALLLGGLLFLGVVLLASNIIRLSVGSRQDQLHLLGLLGASPWRMKRPFFAEALVQGLVSALLAWAVLLGLSWLLRAPALLPFGLSWDQILRLPDQLPLWLAALGSGACLLGALLGVSRAARPGGL